MRNRVLDLPFLSVLLATLGFAFKGIFAKLAFASGMTVAGVLMLRIVLALPLYWLAVWILPRKEQPTSGDWRNALLVGVLFTIATVSDFAAIHALGAGLSRMLLFTFPLFVQLMTAVRERRAPTRKELGVFAVCYLGLFLLFAPKEFTGHLGPDGWAGIAWGLSAAVSYAAFLVLGQGLSNRLGSPRFTAMANTATFLFLVLYAALWVEPADLALPSAGVFWVSIMVMVSTVLPFILLFEGIKHIGAKRASLISLSGPVVTLLAAWVFLGESVVWLQGVGFLLVLVGVAWLQWGDVMLLVIRRPK